MSKFGDQGSGIGDRDRFDVAIDRTVREMLDVEQPAGFRARVLDRIEQPRRGLTWIWIALPVAAAAVLVLALILPRTDPPATKPVTTIATGQPIASQPSTPPATRTPPERPHTVAARSATPPSRPRQQTITAAVAPPDAAADVVWIDALPAPAAVAVAGFDPLPTASVRSIDPVPAQIPALEIRPISDTPRERRNQE